MLLIFFFIDFIMVKLFVIDFVFRYIIYICYCSFWIELFFLIRYMQFFSLRDLGLYDSYEQDRVRQRFDIFLFYLL